MPAIIPYYKSVSNFLPNDFITTWNTTNEGTSNNNQITIPFIGEPNCTVFWGDGTSESVTSSGNVTHTYPEEGQYTVRITNQFTGLQFNNGGDRRKLLSIENWGKHTWSSMQESFYGCSNVVINAIDIQNVTIIGTNFSNAWRDCSGLTSFPLLDVSSGNNFFNAWRDCSGLTSFPLLDVSSGISFSSAWNGCSGLTSFPLLNVSNGSNFGSAWTGCSGLTSFPLLDVSSGISFSSAWNGCSGLTNFPLLNVSNGIGFGSAWHGCSGLTSFPLLDVSNGTSFNSAWRNCSGLTSFPLLDVSNGTGFANIWNGCSNLVTIAPLNVSSGTIFAAAFNNTGSIEEAPLQGTNADINFANNQLQRQAIVDIFNGLANRTGTSSATITITNNPGVDDLTISNKAIATNKNWVINK